MRILISTIILGLASLLPIAASAFTNAGELKPICTAGSPICRAYALGGSERYWLLHSKHEGCEEKDIKTLDAVMDAVDGPKGLFAAAKDPETPASYILLQHLIATKSEMCSLGMRFSELLEKCDAKAEPDQNLCHAYIAGTLDMALAFFEVKAKKEKALEGKTLFCGADMKPKLQMTDAEVMTAIQEWRKARPDRPTKAPAAQEIINALVIKFPCAKNNIQKELK